ncbi:MAG TPA: hypothetical protein VI756_26485, partial [Blastocatellia bacterium]
MDILAVAHFRDRGRRYGDQITLPLDEANLIGIDVELHVGSSLETGKRAAIILDVVAVIAAGKGSGWNSR